MRTSGKGRGSAKRSSKVSSAQASSAQRSSTKAALGRAVRAAGQGSAGEPRVSLYDEVTGRIVAELAAGRAPWVRPWAKGAGVSAKPGLPHNALTGRTYSGVNILLLWGALIERGFEEQGWLTYRQALKAGGQVRRGEQGTVVVYADRFTPDAEAQRAAETGETPGSVPFLKRFTVFNVAQCEGLEAIMAPAAPPPEREIIPHVEALIAATGADFRIGGDEAFYMPAFDYVRVPPQPAFHQPDRKGLWGQQFHPR